MDDDLSLAPALQAVIEGRSLDPFAVLGRHRMASSAVIRVMLPGAFSVTAIARDEPSLQTALSPLRQTGLFVGPSPGPGAYVLRIDWAGRSRRQKTRIRSGRCSASLMSTCSPKASTAISRSASARMR